MTAPDPFAVLGVATSATDAELRAAYRHLAQLHHPDHNGGSAESTRRFSEVQEAYAEIKLRRSRHEAAHAPDGGPADASGVEARLAAMERELAQARTRRERAAAAARAAARQATGSGTGTTRTAAGHATDAELGYVSTDDSFSKIFDDLADEVTARLREPERSDGQPSRTAGRRRGLTDWIDELGSRLTGDDRDR